MYAKGKVFNGGMNAGVMTGEGRKVQGWIKANMGGYVSFGCYMLSEVRNESIREEV